MFFFSAPQKLHGAASRNPGAPSIVASRRVESGRGRSDVKRRSGWGRWRRSTPHHQTRELLSQMPHSGTCSLSALLATRHINAFAKKMWKWKVWLIQRHSYSIPFPLSFQSKMCPGVPSRIDHHQVSTIQNIYLPFHPGIVIDPSRAFFASYSSGQALSFRKQALVEIRGHPKKLFKGHFRIM